MKQLLLSLGLATHLFGAVSIIQSKNSGTGDCGHPCTITLASSVTPGSLLILMAAASSGMANISSVTMTGEHFTISANCNTLTGAVLFSGCAYVLSAVGGSNSITINYSVATFRTNVQVYEIGVGGGTASFDVDGTAIDGVTRTSHSGVSLSLGGTDVVVQAGGVSTTSPFVTAVSSPYNANATFTGGISSFYGMGYAIVLAAASGAAPVWTTANRPFAGVAIAFKIAEPVAGGGHHRVVSQ